MKTRISTRRKANATHSAAMVLLLYCSNILLWTDTGYCKMQQSGFESADPFADTSSSPFDDPFKQSDNPLNSKAEEPQPTGNPTTAAANVSITRSFNIIQSIEPDSWLENGGSSTICPHIVADGSAAVSTLIIGAPTTT